MCSGAGRDRTLAGFYVLCLQLVGAAFMAARGRPQGWPLRPDTLGRACSAEVNAPGRGSRFILGWRVFHGNLFGSVFLPCLRRPRFLAEESGGKDGSGRGIPISPAPTPHPLKRPIRGAAAPLLDVPPRKGGYASPSGAAGALQRKPPPSESRQQDGSGETPRRGNRNSPFLVVSRGMGVGKGGNRNPPFPTGSFAPFWPRRKGPAGGMTRKQIPKGVTWKARRHGAGRADVGRR